MSQRKKFRGQQDVKRDSRRERVRTTPTSVVMGRHVIEELLEYSPERFVEILVGGREEHSDGRLRKLLDKARSESIKVRSAPMSEVTALAGSESHQGIIALVKPRKFSSLDEACKQLEGEERALILLLDGLEDPHNFGAVLRSAECFGVDLVVWSKNRGVDVTSTVSKVSAGASELIQLCPLSNLHAAVKQLKDNDFWIVGSVVDKDARSLNAFEFPKRCALIMGSEESGIQPLVVKELDFKVFVPMRGKIASLNVAQATSVFLSEYGRQGALLDGCVTSTKQ